MRQYGFQFDRDESGAVTTEFVVVAAAVVALGIAVMATVGDSAIDSAAVISSDLADDVDITYPPRTD